MHVTCFPLESDGAVQETWESNLKRSVSLTGHSLKRDPNFIFNYYIIWTKTKNITKKIYKKYTKKKNVIFWILKLKKLKKKNLK